ncbi:MAG: hypothetical protein ABJI60_11725 [Kangiellaceae bacterium]
MSLPKKGSRVISVEGADYLWRVKDNGDHKSLTLQKRDKGQILYSSVSSWGCGEFWDTPITPSLVKLVIEQAMSEGWEPDKENKERHITDITCELFEKSGARID